MLQKSYDYQDKINRFMRDLDNEKYLQYYNTCGYSINLFIRSEDDELNYISRVSIDPETKEIIGYFGAHVDRSHKIITELSIVNFTKKTNYILINDLVLFIHNLLVNYHFRKIRFSVITDNPFRHMCDRVLGKVGGRVIGTAHFEFMLLNGDYANVKYYEIHSQKYFKTKIFNKLATR